jgi:hypothetical protein
MSASDRTGVSGFGVTENDFLASSMILDDPLRLETAMREGKDVFYLPNAAINEDGPYEFLINRDMECFYFLPRTRLHGCFQIIKQNNEACTDADDINISNLMSSCLFSRIELYMNGTQVIEQFSSSIYPYKAFIETFLTYSQECKKTSLRSCLYDEEEPANVETRGKSRKVERNEWISNSKKCQFVTPLHIDALQSEKCLPPNIDLKFRFFRNPQDFGLTVASPAEGQQAVKYKIKLLDLKLEMRKILPATLIKERYLQAIKKQPQLLPFPSARTLNYTLPANITSQTIANVINGRMPRSLIIGFVEAEAFSGSVAKNPFNFQHFNIVNLCLRINGQNYPSMPFSPSFSDGLCMREFRHTIDSIGVSHDNTSNGLTFEQFKLGKTFWCFDFSPDNCNGFHLHRNSYGTIDLDVSFKSALIKSVQAIVYCTFNGGVLINEKLEVKALSNS